ncbi:MAG: hypothetical protein ACRYHQ_12300 [Janthinobacterium lividum]
MLSKEDRDSIPLRQVNGWLIDSGFAAPGPGYDRIYKGVLNGLFPGVQSANGRWSIRRNDLPKVAAWFGTDPTSAASARRAFADASV